MPRPPARSRPLRSAPHRAAPREPPLPTALRTAGPRSPPRAPAPPAAAGERRVAVPAAALPSTHRHGDALPQPGGPGLAHVRTRLPRRRYAAMAAEAELGGDLPSSTPSLPADPRSPAEAGTLRGPIGAVRCAVAAALCPAWPRAARPGLPRGS